MKTFPKIFTRLIFVLLTAPLCAVAQAPKSVGIFLYDNVELLDFAGPAEVFQASGFDVSTVSADGQKIISQRFLHVDVDYSLETSPHFDIIVIPGGNTSPSVENPVVIDWVNKQYSEGASCMSVCTGAAILSKAGLLDGLKVTTWYGFIPRLQAQTPEATVLEKTRFVDSGRIMTTAGVSAGIDGALYVVAKINGPDAAAATARYMEYDKWDPKDGLIDYTHPFFTEFEKTGNESSSLKTTKANSDVPAVGEFILYTNSLKENGRATEANQLLNIGIQYHPYAFPLFSLLRESDPKYSAIPGETAFMQMVESDVARASADQHRIRKEFPGWLLYSENAINVMGYGYLNEKAFDDAIRVFTLYTESYPESWIAFDSLAEAYMVKGEDDKAIEGYRKSLTLNPRNSNATSMIEKIMAK